MQIDKIVEKFSTTKLIDEIIEQAIKKNASDVHIEPTKNNLRIRLRIDGDLHVIHEISLKYHSSIISRIKVIGNMDIAERRVAQDGRIDTVIMNNEIDIRLSTMPTVYGEKVVLRLLNKTKFNYKIGELGFNESNLHDYIELISQPYGMILISGPTGSGKTTTMYTTLKEINDNKKNIITIEDPVEYKIDGVNQIQVNNKAGLNFSSGLRSILRQDPDYIFIGEIRDHETSSLAVRAAITGHLLFSTLHTNDSVSAIHRLIDMGIEPYLLATSLIGVVSQRLVKLLCPECKERYIADGLSKDMLDIKSEDDIYFYRALGCRHCNNGYLGRTAIFEVLRLDKEKRSLIDNNSNANMIRKSSLDSGMITLFHAAKSLLIEGMTSFEEVIKLKII